MAVEEKWEGRKEHFGYTGSNIVRPFTSTWAARHDEKDELLGAQFSDAGGTIDWLVCTSVDISMLGDPDSAAGGPLTALLLATYTAQTQGASMSPDEELVESWEFSIEALTIGGNAGYHWESDGETIADRSAVKYFPRAIITLSGARATLDKSTIVSLLGKVNKSEWRGFGKEVLRFDGPSASKTWGGTGDDLWQLNYKFACNPEGWNRFWRPSTQTFDTIDPLVYETADFPELT